MCAYVKQHIKNMNEIQKVSLANQERVMGEYMNNEFQKVKTLMYGDHTGISKKLCNRWL